MARPIQEPEVQKNDNWPDSETVLTHPAFGQIMVSRVSGITNLYGSDFKHHSYVVIRIARSELHRSLSRDWFHSRERLIEVALSEAQWATFVSAFNVGEGVPCTIERINNTGVPGIPHRDESQEYKTEANQAMQDSLNDLKALRADIVENTAGLSKAKQAALLERVEKSIRSLSQTLPFIADSFAEHMENRVEKAKVEVNAYATGTVQRLGLEAIAKANGGPVLEIGGPGDDD